MYHFAEISQNSDLWSFSFLKIVKNYWDFSEIPQRLQRYISGRWGEVWTQHCFLRYRNTKTCFRRIWVYRKANVVFDREMHQESSKLDFFLARCKKTNMIQLDSDWILSIRISYGCFVLYFSLKQNLILHKVCIVFSGDYYAYCFDILFPYVYIVLHGIANAE